MRIVNLTATLAGIPDHWNPRIVGELNGAQGKPVDLGGYYHPCEKKTATAMRPSATLNEIVANAGRAAAMA
jgi:isocitrate dehydrogenase